MVVFSMEQDKAQRSALQSVVKQAAIRQFRAVSDLEASGQDWENLGLTIAGRSTVIGANSRSVSARAMCLRFISRRQENVFDMRPSGEYWEDPPLFFWVTNLFRPARAVRRCGIPVSSQVSIYPITSQPASTLLGKCSGRERLAY